MASMHGALPAPASGAPPPSAYDPKNLVPYFGLPAGGEAALEKQLDPYAAFPRETLHLPNVYKGYNPYLTNIMIEFVTEEDLVPTKILLPLRETYNETMIVWDEYHFNNALLGPVPEEGVSRLVTQQISERQDHYVRAGLAFMIEHGFYMSEKGKRSYALQLEQIKNATLDALYIGVIESLLMCKTVSNYYIQMYGQTMSKSAQSRRLKLDVEAWAEVQKSEHGWDMLNARAFKALKLNGVVPDAWVVPEGTRTHVSNISRENFSYFLAGPKGRELYDSALPGANDKKVLDVHSGALIFETKHFEVPGTTEPINPLARDRSIGEYAVSFPHLPVMNNAAYEYSSEHRSILVYNEAIDSWDTLTLRHGLENCMRFGPGRDEDGTDFDGGDHGIVFPDDGDLDEYKGDMFIAHKKDKTVECAVKYFGDMSPAGLTEDAVKDWTASVIAGLPEDTRENLRALDELVKTLESPPLSAVHFFSKTFVDIESGFMILAEGEVPYGFGNAAGVKYLAGEDMRHMGKWHDLAKKGYKGLEELHARLEAVCYDNIFMRAEAQPSYYRERSEINALFANLYHVAQPPLLVQNDKNVEKLKTKALIDKLISFDKSMNIRNASGEINKDKTGMCAELLKTILINDDATDTDLPVMHNTIDSEVGKRNLSENKSSPFFNALAFLFNMYVKKTDFTMDKLTDFGPNAPLVDGIINTAAMLFARLHNPEYVKLAGLFNFFYASTLALLHTPDTGIHYKHIYAIVNTFINKDNMKDFAIAVLEFCIAAKGIVNPDDDDEKSNCKIEIDESGRSIVKSTFSREKIYDTYLGKGANTGGYITTQMTASRDIIRCLLSNRDITKSITVGVDHSIFADGGFTSTAADIAMLVSGSMVPESELPNTEERRTKMRKVAAGADMFDLAARPVACGSPSEYKPAIESAAMADGAGPPFVGAMPGRSRFGIVSDTPEDRARQHREMGGDAGQRPGILAPPTEAFTERFNRYNDTEGNNLERVVKQAMLGIPVTKEALEHFIEKDVVFPFNILYFRPYMTYTMGNGVCLKSGKETGETLVGQADFQLGDDPLRKIHIGNYTVRYKSVVYNDRRVYHALNMLCEGYRGGNDCTFYKSPGDINDYLNRSDRSFRSIFSILAPYQRTQYKNPIDITGFHQRDLKDLDDGGANPIPHYPTAKFYSKMWNWSNGNDPAGGGAPNYTADIERLNTLVYQGHQAMYNPQTMSLTKVIPNTGHWGRNVYPGCGKVRAGLAKVLEQVTFSDVYGGAGQASNIFS